MAQALYQQIVRELRRRMASGEYPVGSRIPPETQLVQQLGASRPTVRQALALLEQEGRLVRVKGSGTFVAEPKLVHESTSFLTGYREESRKKHRVVHTRVLGLQTLPATPTVAAALQLSTGAPVVQLTRCRQLENMYAGAPVVYTTVWVPLQLFPDMPRLDLTDASFYEALDKRGLSVVHASRRLEVLMPPPEAAQALDISAFEPAVFIASKGYLADGRPIEYSESYYPASRSSFLIEVDR